MTNIGKGPVKALFERAVEYPAKERAGYLDRMCGPDGGLREKVETLLRAHDQAEEVEFLTTEVPLEVLWLAGHRGFRIVDPDSTLPVPEKTPNSRKVTSPRFLLRSRPRLSRGESGGGLCTRL